MSRTNVRANLRPPPPPVQARRKPLPGQISRATSEIRLVLNRIEKLIDDDRFSKIKDDHLAGQLRAQLARGAALHGPRPAPPPGAPDSTERYAESDDLLDSYSHPWVATFDYAGCRSRSAVPMDSDEAYFLCELIVRKFGTLDRFAEAVRAKQATQPGMPDVLPPVDNASAG